jgi:preprotein translocase subunit SecG
MKCTNIAVPYCVKYTYPGQGVSDFGCDSASQFGALTIRQTATGGRSGTGSASTSLPTVSAGALDAVTTGGSDSYTGGTSGGSGGTTTGSSDTYTSSSKKLAIGVIVGIVIAVLAVLFFIIIGIVMCLKKKKKQKQIAANAQIMANNQANRPQSEFQPVPPQQQQQMQPQMQQDPPPAQSPQPTLNSYFSPPGQQEQKYNGHSSVHEYSTPVSNPTTPAPAYVQPYMANAPPMPQAGQYQPPANGAHEVPSPVPQQHSGQYQPPMNGAHEVPSPGSQQHPVQYQPPMNGAHEVSSPNMSQPYNQAVSPVQQQPFAAPPAVAHEVHASSVPHAPGNTSGPVYEMGQGK